MVATPQRTTVGPVVRFGTLVAALWNDMKRESPSRPKCSNPSAAKNAPTEPAPPKPRRAPYAFEAFDDARWPHPSADLLATWVRVLDSRLGRQVAEVQDLLDLQSMVIARQKCAQRALGMEPARRLSHLVHPRPDMCRNEPRRAG